MGPIDATSVIFYLSYLFIVVDSSFNICDFQVTSARICYGLSAILNLLMTLNQAFEQLSVLSKKL
jgi:hypothetical protein